MFNNSQITHSNLNIECICIQICFRNKEVSIIRTFFKWHKNLLEVFENMVFKYTNKFQKSEF